MSKVFTRIPWQGRISAACGLSLLRLAANLFSIGTLLGMGPEIDWFGVETSPRQWPLRPEYEFLTARRQWRARFFFVFCAHTRFFMADITESAESRQLLENLKGRMLVLKEHL